MAEKKKDDAELDLTEKPAEPIDVEVEVAESTPAVQVETTPPEKKEGDDIDEAVAALQQQLADAETARLAEANRANEEAAKRTKAEGELKTFRSSAHESQYSLVVGQIESLNEKAGTLERDLVDAHAQGDYTKVAKTQREMSRIEAQIQRLEDGKADLEARKTETPTEDVQPVKQIGDPVEKFITNLQVSDRDRTWLRKHRDIVTDQRKFEKLSNTAAFAANVEGLAPDSDEFYAFIEQKLGIAPTIAPATAPARTEPAPPAQRRAPQFAAPPSRDTTTVNGTQKKTGKIRLSPAQQEAATTAGMTPGEYAKHLVKLVETGELDARNVQYVN